MKSNVLGSLLCAIVVSLVFAGCSAEKKVYNGSVTLDGNPLDNAGVKLVSKDSSARGEHFSTTDGSGKFVIQDDPNNPLTPGDYVVVVDKVPEEMGGKSIVPDEYRKATSSPINLTIPAVDEDVSPIEIELTSK